MFAYGVIIEAVQAFEPQRAAELKDLAVDFAGICIGLTLMPWLGPRVRSWGDRLAILIVNDGS